MSPAGCGPKALVASLHSGRPDFWHLYVVPITKTAYTRLFGFFGLTAICGSPYRFVGSLLTFVFAGCDPAGVPGVVAPTDDVRPRSGTTAPTAAAIAAQARNLRRADMRSPLRSPPCVPA